MASHQWRRVYDATMLVLSVYVIGQLSIEVILDIPQSTRRLLTGADFVIACIFLVNWLVFLVVTQDKRHYFLYPVLWIM